MPLKPTVVVVGYLKAHGHMSYSTLQAFFDDVMNLDISSGYLVKCCTQKLSPALIPSYEEALQYIRNALIVGSDETGHKNPAYKSIWTWCERAWTIVATCAAQNRSVFKYFHESLKAHYTNTPYPSILPQNL